MDYDPQKGSRRSLRHPGHNYSSAGYYFITISTHQKEHLFGAIHHPVMKLNDFGLIAARFWKIIPERYHQKPYKMECRESLNGTKING